MARKNRNQTPATETNVVDEPMQESVMVEDHSNEGFENTENTEAAVEGAAVVEEPKVDERYKMVTHKDGTQEKRKDYIHRRWVTDKISRGQIAKELTELCGKKIPYQIVFAATKGVKGGPDKVDPAAAPAEASNETSAASE